MKYARQLSLLLNHAPCRAMIEGHVCKDAVAQSAVWEVSFLPVHSKQPGIGIRLELFELPLHLNQLNYAFCIAPF